MLACARWAVLTVVAVSSLSAQNPADIDFKLQLVKDSHSYTVDEPIPFTLSLTSTVPHKYRAQLPEYSCYGSSIQLEPADQAFDLRGFQVACLITGNAQLLRDLTEEPATDDGDITRWYRFEKPGHYRVSIRIDIQQASEIIPITSNTVEFDILPPSSVELQSLPEQRLDLLQTPAAIEEKLKRYLADPNGFGPYYGMLRHSSHIDLLLPPLEQALTDPARVLPASIESLLATLQIRKQLGEKAYSSASIPDERVAAATYNQKLLDTIPSRSGPARAQAQYIVWLSTTSPIPDGLLDSLREIPFEERRMFLDTVWRKMPHFQILPAVRDLAQWKSAANPGYFRGFAYRLWCEAAPDECIKAVLTEAQQPDFAMRTQLITLFALANYPELDTAHRSDRTTEDLVKTFLAAHTTEPARSDVESYWLSYLFNTSSPHALQSLDQALHDPRFGVRLLQAFWATWVAPETSLPFVSNYLTDTGDTTSAQRAAAFLSTYGNPSAKAALMDRLRTVHDNKPLEAALVSALLNGKAWTLTREEKAGLLQRIQ